MLGVHHSVIFFIRGYRKGNGEPTFCVVSPNTGGKEEVRKATNQADRREVNPRSRCQVLHHLKKLNSEQEVQGTFWIFSLQQISGWYLGLRSAFFTSGPSCSCTPSSGRDSSFLRLPAHVARRRAGHISSVPSHDRISFAPRPRVDGGAVGDCNWDDLSSPSNILFNLSHGRNTFPNTSGGSPLLGRHRQWYVIHRIFYALVLSSRYLSRGSRDLYVSLLIISSSHTSNLSLVFRFRSQAWSIRPRGRNISHFLHLHDLLDVRS